MTEPTILEKIKAYKLEEIEAAKAARPLAQLEAAAREVEAVRPFGTALMEAARPG